MKRLAVSLAKNVKSKAEGGVNLVRYSREYSIAQQYLFDHPLLPLTREQKDEIDDYWNQYGISFPDYSWHQMYYGVTGIANPRFMPDVFVVSVIYPHYNRQNYLAAWDDKNMYAKLVNTIKFPEVLCHCMNGRFYDAEWNAYSRSGKDFENLCSSLFEKTCNDDGFIIKESTNTNSGKGVKVWHTSSPSDLAHVLTDNNSQDFVVQKKIIQNDFFSQFNSTSVNIIRIVSWRHGDDVVLFPASIRYGIEGSHTDIVFVNGKEIANVVGIDDTGFIKNTVVSFDGKTQLKDTIKNRKVPSWDILRQNIISAHKRMPFFDIVGWDFTINAKGEPVCIEYNIIKPGTILYQYANGPFAGDYTDKLLAFLKSKPVEMPWLFRKQAKGKQWIVKIRKYI